MAANSKIVPIEQAQPAMANHSMNAVSTTVEIEGADGALQHYPDPMALMVACAGDYSGHKPMQLGEPLAASRLSGRPGYLYRRDDIEIVLTRDELLRLILNALTPDEFRKLRELFGALNEIGPEFYDQDSGKALQPKVKVPQD
ncbi:MAG: hypothetical protein P8Y64_04015 [Gammaproteobacteria bacterium]